MTLAEKYASKASKSLKEQLLKHVENKLQHTKDGERFIYTIGWWECGYENVLSIECCNPFDAMTNIGSRQEINDIMKAEGFKIIEDYGGYRHRANTNYVLEK